jgi:arylsulfatase A-like enzyme
MRAGGSKVGSFARGSLLGGGYGLAVACVESWMFVGRMAQMGLPARDPHVDAAALQVAIGAVLGALLSPLLRVPRAGAVLHLAAVAGAWFAIGDATAPESGFLLPLLVGPPVGGLVLAWAGLALARWRRWLPAALGVALLAGAWGFAGARRAQEQPTPPNVAGRPVAPAGAPDVVVVVLDTVRADHVSAYGYERPTTPSFDALARDGALFLAATSPATWSLPSHASLFTGLFPSGHGAHDEHPHLRADVPTLGEALAAAGFETACFTANPWISDALGTARGFDQSDDAWREANALPLNSVHRLLDVLGFGSTDKGGAAVAANFERWLASRPPDARPYFAFMNFLEAHFPYHQLPAEYLGRFASGSRRELRELSMQLVADQFGSSDLDRAATAGPARDMYDGGVLYADALLGRVVEALRRRGSLDRTLVVVLSDHGELLGEHGGFGHGRALTEPGTHVPLLVRLPGRVPAARVAAPVSTVGVMGTVLELAGVPAPGPLHVGSLLPALDGRPAGAPVLAERFLPRGPDRGVPGGDPLLRLDVRQRAYRADDTKLVEASDGARFAFDLAADPAESRDLAAERPDEVARLVSELATWRTALGLPALDAPVQESAPPVELDPAARERLKALGYVE